MPSELVFPITEADELIKNSKEFLWSRLRLPLAQGTGLDSQVLSAPGGQRAVRIIQALEELRPNPSGTMNRHAFMRAKGGSLLGARQRCNAAVALSFPRPRFNHRPADRLAIVANLRESNIRLDTVQIEQNFQSLAVSLFVLAFMIGNLSLLIPEGYQRSLIRGNHLLTNLFSLSPAS